MSAQLAADEVAGEHARLWQAILDKVNPLTGGRSGSRSMGYYAKSGPYIACRCIATVVGDDGATTVYDLEATRNTAWPVDHTLGHIDVRVQTYRDDRDEFWGPLVKVADDGQSAVIGHVHYRIDKDLPAGRPDHCAGFGGREHTIEFFDGRTVTTRNLWTQGLIPPAWRDRLPDNARFAQPGDSASKAALAEPEPDESDPRQIATDLIHEHAREMAMRGARDAVAERFDLKALDRAGFAAKVEEVREHIVRATVTVEIPDEVTE